MKRRQLFAGASALAVSAVVPKIPGGVSSFTDGALSAESKFNVYVEFLRTEITETLAFSAGIPTRMLEFSAEDQYMPVSQEIWDTLFADVKAGILSEGPA